ncbi:MAG TPA: NRDE family protein [Phycisphaerae bacterium]|nr:NRDE family protein [Phycisphaerae bacterium]
MSWTSCHEGYDLFFNRDERDARATEQPPTRAHRDGVAYLAPRDGEHGGTWLGVNQRGVTICLLNDYTSRWAPPSGQPSHSRGHVVTACMAAERHSDVLAAVQSQPLERTGAFRLLALTPEEGALVLHWRGTHLVRHEAPVSPLSSSSHATTRVVRDRLRRYSVMVSAHPPLPETLAKYHRQHSPSARASSVLMRRSDAATRSLIHVTVRPDRVCLTYTPVHWIGWAPQLQSSLHAVLSRAKDAVLVA